MVGSGSAVDVGKPPSTNRRAAASFEIDFLQATTREGAGPADLFPLSV